jgi:hypothetical protein
LLTIDGPICPALDAKTPPEVLQLSARIQPGELHNHP